MNAIKRLPSNVQQTLGDNLLHGQTDITSGNAFCEAARPALVEAQGALVAAREQQEVGHELTTLNEALRADDLRHDRLVALISLGIEAGITLAELRGEGADATFLQGCMDTLLPEGRVQAQKPWHEEAGDAPVLAARLTSAQRARLEALPIAGVSIWALVEEWVAVARSLGGLLTRRAELLATQGEAVPLNDVRLPWGSAFASFLTGLGVSGLSPADQRRLREPFDEAVRMHRARLRRRGVAGEGAEPSAVAAPPALVTDADPPSVGVDA